MYGLYKQALQDPTFEKAEQPGTFDFKNKAKYKAWKTVVDAGVTPEEAQVKYVALIENMKKTYGYDAGKEPEAVGGSS
jgi:diazepam-binding inhibitor (GABA receptor modulating acyl-CoA-binding protein)